MTPSNCYDLLKENWTEQTARQELFLKHPLPPIYTCFEKKEENLKESITERITRIVIQVFSILFFPIYLFQKYRQIRDYSYQLGHGLIGTALFPALFKNRNQILRLIEDWNINTFVMRNLPFSIGVLPIMSLIRPPVVSGVAGSVLDFVLKWVGKRDKKRESQWQPQRFTIAANREKIDAIFVGRRRSAIFLRERLFSKIKTLLGRSLKVEAVSSGRVILYCCSQAELSEWVWCDANLLSLAEKTRSEVVVWNHPGLGSSGSLTRNSVVKTYDAMLQFLEDPKGFGAKEIICCGSSLLGSSIALEALKNHELHSSIRYVLLLNGASSTIQSAISSVSALFGAAVKFFGWDMNNVEALKKIKAPALILQTARVDNYEVLLDSAKLIPDGVIEDPDATLAKSLLDEEERDPMRKVVGVPRWHDEPLAQVHIDALAGDLDRFLNKRI